MTQDIHEERERRAHPAGSPHLDSKVRVEGADSARPAVLVVGQVDGDVVAETSAVVGDLVASGVRDLVVDLRASWNGAGLLPVLAGARHELAEAGGALRVLGVALPEFLAALRTASLDEVFLIYDEVRRGSMRA